MAAEGGNTLLKVIKNPVTQYFPVGCRKIGTSHHLSLSPWYHSDTVDLVYCVNKTACTSDTSKLVNLQSFVASLEKPNDPIVFIIGAHARGSDEVDYADQYICFSNYPLSAALACSKVTTAFEQLWGVL